VKGLGIVVLGAVLTGRVRVVLLGHGGLWGQVYESWHSAAEAQKLAALSTADANLARLEPRRSQHKGMQK
jgi:hypothetical protein